MPEKNSKLIPASISLPDELVNSTIGQLIQSGDVDISKKGNKVSVRRMTDESTLFLEYTGYPDGVRMSGTKIDRAGRKKDLARTVRQMREEGMTYAEIAKRTGMSIAYARALCQDM